VTVGLPSAQGSAAWHAMSAGWAPVLAILCALSILLGNFVALAQTNVRRLLAYSAVAHGGYTLLGLIIGGRDGFAATLFYTTIYAFTLIGAFAVVGLVRRETGGDDLKNFAGLSARSPLVAACMSIFTLSLAGLPPLAGFFGKFYLFSAALGAQTAGKSGAFAQPSLLWLVVVALFGTLISLYYYLMILKAIYVDEDPSAKADAPLSRDSDLLQKSTVALLAAIVLFLGIMPGALTARILASLP
jgi:NADH-quinone oxidoreductase subunit N